MKQIFFYCCTFLFTVNGYGQERILTLKQSIETAIANNLQVRQSDLQMQSAGVNLKQSRANIIPDLFGNLGHGINQGRSIDPFTNSYINQQVNYANYNLSTNVVLFNGFQLQNTLKQNALSFEASKMEWRQSQDNITLNVILAYLQILSNADQLSQSQIQAELTRRQVERLSI
jgi:outer membrane protein